MSDETKNNYVNNTLWGLLEKSARIISGILVGILVVRFLGKEQYGIIAYGLGIIGILTIFSTLGLDGLVVRELITRGNRKNVIMGSAFWLRFTGSFVVMAGATFYSSLRDPASVTWIVFLLSISIVFQSLSIIDFHFQASVKGRYTAINQVITLFISALVKLYLIYVEAPLEWFACMAALEAMLVAINQLIFYKRDSQQIKLWKFEWQEAKYLLILSSPVILSSFLQLLYQKADRILIERFLHDFGLVGNYDAGVRIAEASYVIPVAVCAAVFPGIVNNRHNRELQLKRLTQLFSIMFWSALIIAIGGTIFGDWAIRFLYGSKFELAPSIFKIFIWMNIPVFWGTAWGMWMLSENKQRYIVWMQLLNGSIILISEFIMIPKIGVTGAAYSMLAGCYVAYIFMLFSYKPKESIPLFLKALNPKSIWEVFKYSKK